PLAEDDLVVRRVVADRVPEDLRRVLLVAGRDRPRRGEARVIEALAVGEPRDRRVIRVRDALAEVLARRDVAHVERALLAAALAPAPREEGPVVRDVPPVERGRRVLAQRRGIEEHAIFAANSVANVEDRVVVVALALLMKVPPLPGCGRSDHRPRD